MKVKELIEQLQQYNGEKEVYFVQVPEKDYLGMGIVIDSVEERIFLDGINRVRLAGKKNL